MQQPAIDILDANRIMTIATVRPDGWPQATIVGYANEAWSLYFLIYRDSQKFQNIARDCRVAITVGSEPSELRQIRAVYAGCDASELTDLAERSRAWNLLAERHPNLTDLAPPKNRRWRPWLPIAVMCPCSITPKAWATRNCFPFRSPHFPSIRDSGGLCFLRPISCH